MARPVAQRTLAGFTLGELLGRQVYGDLYRASGEGRREARLLVVAPALAGDVRFSDALARGTAPLLGAFHHRAVVGTVVVARDGKDLVIVTDGVKEPRSLDDVLARVKGRGLPPRIAATIARSVIDGVATAHALGISHGALHPRSILVDGEGVVRVTDFAVGFAAMTAAAGGSEAVPLRGLGGYLAPELALGDEPGPTTDVYAIGALLFALLSGSTPPGTLVTTPAIERLVQRALDTDLHRRFANAIELQENFAEALEDDRWELAQPGEVAHALAELPLRRADSGPVASAAIVGAGGAGAAAGGSSGDGNLDDATEDLLASLSGAIDAPRPAVDVASAAVAAAPVVAPRSKRGSGGLDSLLDDLEEPEEADESDDGSAHTSVDNAPYVAPQGQAGRDPISEIIALAPAPTPEEPVRSALAAARRSPALAAPDPTGETLIPAPGTPPPPLADDDDDDGVAAPTARSKTATASLKGPAPAAAAAAVAAPVAKTSTPATSMPVVTATAVTAATAAAKAAAATDAAEPPARRRVTPIEEVPAPNEPPRLARSYGWVWALIVILAGAGLAYGISRQKGELSAGEKKAAIERQQKIDEAKAIEQRLIAAKAKAGTIRVTSTPDQGSVWLLLGRTPFESISIGTNNVWELRVELEGYQSIDTRVGGNTWSGPKDDQRARIAVPLTAGTLPAPLPAMPAAPPPGERGGIADGRGQLTVETTPRGAAVWLLVGTTDTMALTGIEAGRDYEFKVLRDGYLPGFARVAAEDWRDGGDPKVPLAGAAMKKEVVQAVELAPAPKTGKRPER